MRKTLDPQKINDQALTAMSSFHSGFVNDVEQAVQKHEWVVVGMKQNPVVKTARNLLSEKGKAFEYLEHGSYMSGWKQRLAVKLWSGWPTFPQVFHKGVLIGGAADLKKYLEKH